jgi:hypothetical protein
METVRNPPSGSLSFAITSIVVPSQALVAALSELQQVAG